MRVEQLSESERIDNLDFKFNAYLTVCRQQALDQA